MWAPTGTGHSWDSRLSSQHVVQSALWNWLPFPFFIATSSPSSKGAGCLGSYTMEAGLYTMWQYLEKRCSWWAMPTLQIWIIYYLQSLECQQFPHQKSHFHKHFVFMAPRSAELICPCTWPCTAASLWCVPYRGSWARNYAKAFTSMFHLHNKSPVLQKLKRLASHLRAEDHW